MKIFAVRNSAGERNIHIMTRREQREAVLELLFETEFKKDENPEEIFALAAADREFTVEAGSYIKDVYFDLLDKLAQIDEVIGKCSAGWKTTRLSRLSRSIMRLCVYEQMYRKDIPTTVSINEAVELSKKFDDPKARSFVNGVLNGVKELLATGYKPDGEQKQETPEAEEVSANHE